LRQSGNPPLDESRFIGILEAIKERSMHINSRWQSLHDHWSKSENSSKQSKALPVVIYMVNGR